MKPKTIFQKKIDSLRKFLPAISDKQLQWGYDNCFDRSGFLTKSKAHCIECGYSWPQERSLVATIVGLTCPNCDSELKMSNTRKRSHQDAAHFAILTTVKGIQVVRMFFLRKTGKVGQRAEFTGFEVMQHWIDSKGKSSMYAMNVNTMTGYYDSWTGHGELHLRDRMGNGAILRSSIVPHQIYPRRGITPEIKRNGFDGHLYDQSPSDFFRMLLSDSKAETLLKARQISLLKYLFYKYCGPETLSKYWNSVKICIRNGYLIKDASLWTDYIDLLEHFNKDLLSSHYVCPVELKKSHDKLMRKRQSIQERARVEQLRKDIAEAEIHYQQQKGQFFGLLFSNGEITVKMLESVKEFQEEGDTLKHCVFVNQYYKRQDIIVLSARIDDQPVETIELSLNTLKVIQARGMNNKPTEHHGKIVSLVYDNLNAITGRMQ
ncbi:PcfJ domain-containing protein [Dyadobacter sp. CY261]|uniref:PcfJ domain-containing protein n=1 Tax=Dyadobacter sp. CY261 TaxID=2907203 RepID=UPI001F2B9C56|nr:PcfJ domain-containing protein [Dyadobacter sp. CY261]MCF0074022.1 PcfJ domain-containing protein [Dyadobacter sp. CY261]